jgi:anti-sigma factor RsiW
MNKKLSEHEISRERMALAVAGALDESEERTLTAHLASCQDCAVEFDHWRELAGAMRRLPTPQAPPAMVERARTLMVAHLMERTEQRANHRAMAWLLLFAWTTTLATWPILRFVSSGVASFLDVSFQHTWHLLIGYTVLSWIAAAGTAAILGLRQRRERGLA